MSETQLKVTGSFQAADEAGNNYTINEYTIFRHTTDAEMEVGDSADKIYKLGNGSPVAKLSNTEFEIESSKTRVRIL